MPKVTRTTEGMVAELVSDRISAIEDMVREDDRVGLEARLTSVLTSELYEDAGANPYEDDPAWVFHKVRLLYEQSFCVEVADV